MSMAERKRYAEVMTIADGAARVIDARGWAYLSVISTSSGITATVSRVDSAAATAHTEGVMNAFTVANKIEKTPVDWPFYRISSVGGAVRVGLV